MVFGNKTCDVLLRMQPIVTIVVSQKAAPDVIDIIHMLRWSATMSLSLYAPHNSFSLWHTCTYSTPRSTLYLTNGRQSGAERFGAGGMVFVAVRRLTDRVTDRRRLFANFARQCLLASDHRAAANTRGTYIARAATSYIMLSMKRILWHMCVCDSVSGVHILHTKLLLDDVYIWPQVRAHNAFSRTLTALACGRDIHTHIRFYLCTARSNRWVIPLCVCALELKEQSTYT